MSRLIRIVFLTTTMVSSATIADIVVICNQGKTLLPIKQGDSLMKPVEETEISMECETVEIIEEKSQWFKVKCLFVMKSHSKDRETRTVGFPIERPYYREFVNRFFEARVDNEPVKTAIYMNVENSWATEMYWKPDYDRNRHAGYVTWTMSWAPGETRTVACTYGMGKPDVFHFGLVRGWRLRYVIRTGALWKGNIGRADITATFKPESDENSLMSVWSEMLRGQPGVIFRYSYPSHAQWDGQSEIKWHFENYDPNDDLVIEKLAWIGLNKRYHFRLPDPYKADKELYTDDIVEELVTNELKPWQDRFPEEVKALDRSELKALIAQCLSQEILARHGEAFSLGQMKKGQRPPPGATSLPSGSGHCYGKWHNYFMAYRYHGGWYEPDPEKTKGAISEELKAFERQNMTLLKKYLVGQYQSYQ